MPPNDTKIDGIPAVNLDIQTEMELFDKLPEELRQLLNHCPIKACAVSMYRKSLFGYKLRLGMKEQWTSEFKAAFPDWKPFKNDVFPI